MYVMKHEYIDKIRNPIDDFLIRISIMIKEMYKQLFIYRQFSGIKTITYTHTLPHI